MKEKYETPEYCIYKYAMEDIITISGTDILTGVEEGDNPEDIDFGGIF